MVHHGDDPGADRLRGAMKRAEANGGGFPEAVKLAARERGLNAVGNAIMATDGGARPGNAEPAPAPTLNSVSDELARLRDRLLMAEEFAASLVSRLDSGRFPGPPPPTSNVEARPDGIVGHMAEQALELHAATARLQTLLSAAHSAI